jgi:hypothetical protein
MPRDTGYAPGIVKVDRSTRGDPALPRTGRAQEPKGMHGTGPVGGASKDNGGNAPGVVRVASTNKIPLVPTHSGKPSTTGHKAGHRPFRG